MTIPADVFGCLSVQYWDATSASWKPFGAPTACGSTLRSRRIAPAKGGTVTTSKIRIVKSGADDWGGAVFSLDQVQPWHEAPPTADDADVVKLWSFNFDAGVQRYILASTGGNLEVFQAGARQASAMTPYSTAALPVVQRCQQLDTLIATQQDFPPWRIMRQGSNSEWDSRVLDLTNVPIFDYTGLKLNGVNEVQQISFFDYADGDTFNITIEDATTPSLLYSSDPATMEARLKSAIEALPNFGPGQITVAPATAGVGWVAYSITYGGDAGASDIGQLASVTLVAAASDAYTTDATLTQGVGGGERVFSPTRGYPAACAFAAQRLFLAGLKSRPETILASRTGSYFNFNIKGVDDSVALSEDLVTNEVTAIAALFPGKHLLTFTVSSEFYLDNPIKAFTPINWTSDRGIQPSTSPAAFGDAVLFVTQNGNAIAGMQFDFSIDKYSSDYISTDASHLVVGITDLAVRKSQSTKAPYLVMAVRDDGQAAVLNALPDQDVMGFARWTTQGRFLASAAEMGGDLYVAVRRQGTHGPVRCFERYDETRLLDCSVVVDGAATEVSVPHLAGMTASIYVDGSDCGDVLVPDNGVVVLPKPALRRAEVGLLFQPELVTLPGVLQQDPRFGRNISVRAGRVDLNLGPSAGLMCGIVGGKEWRVKLTRRPHALLDQGPGENAFEGWTAVDSIPGFRETSQVRLVQPRPGPLMVKAIVATVSS